MRKTNKKQKWYSLHLYMAIHKKWLLNNLVLLLAVSLCLGPIAKAQDNQVPVFIVLKANSSYKDFTRALKAKGGQIVLGVPPRIIHAKAPLLLDITQFSQVEWISLGPIAKDKLNGFGPAAQAAGLQWNRSQVGAVQHMGASFLKATQDHIGLQSLGKPSELKGNRIDQIVSLSWEAVPGATYFEVEGSNKESFVTGLFRTITEQPKIEIPLLTGNGNLPMYIRVRSVDRTISDGSKQLIQGPWSAPVRIDPPGNQVSPSPANSPTLSSPFNNFVTPGFLAILEWIGNENPTARVQVSDSPDFSSTVVDTIARKNEFSIPSAALMGAEQFYWRVQYWSGAQSPWSEARTFSIGEPIQEYPHAFMNPEAPK